MGCPVPKVIKSQAGSLWLKDLNNSKEKISPTSAVKLMTGIIAVEELEGRLDEKVTLTKDMLKNV
mgnify:CR=1 FL=1